MASQSSWRRSKVAPLEPRTGSANPGFVLLCTAVFLGGFSAVFLWDWPESQATDTSNQTAARLLAPTADTIDAKFGICGDGPRSTCVVDGDTIWLYGTKIRIADINTPEVSEPGCRYEADLGQQATRRLQSLLNEGTFSVEQIDHDEDRYGRKLRVITRGGSSLGDVLVDEGLAERWTGSRRNWC